MISFAVRPPSTQWEPAPLPLPWRGAVWCWFKPAQSPQDIHVQVPAEAAQMSNGGLTLRGLSLAAGLDPAEIEAWMLNNSVVPHTVATTGFLDQPLGWFAGTVVFRVRASSGGGPIGLNPAPVATQMPPGFGMPVVAGTTEDAHESLLHRIEADWNGMLQAESALSMLRKQLDGSASRMKTCNRELSMEENHAADSQDKKEWQDIRRSLRDASTNVSRAMREIDVGDLVTTGNRLQLEELHKLHVVERRPAANLLEIANDIEVYRKQVQNQLQKVQAAVSGLGREAEQKAAAFLNRIGAKVRSSRGKRGH